MSYINNSIHNGQIQTTTRIIFMWVSSGQKTSVVTMFSIPIQLLSISRMIWVHCHDFGNTVNHQIPVKKYLQLQLWPFISYNLVINGITYAHSIHGLFFVLKTGIAGHKCCQNVQCGAPKVDKLAYNYNFTRVYGSYKTQSDAS